MFVSFGYTHFLRIFISVYDQWDKSTGEATLILIQKNITQDESVLCTHQTELEYSKLHRHCKVNSQIQYDRQ